MTKRFKDILEDTICAISNVIFIILLCFLTVIIIPIIFILKFHSSWEKCPQCKSRTKTLLLSSEETAEKFDQMWCCQSCQYRWFIVYKR